MTFGNLNILHVDFATCIYLSNEPTFVGIEQVQRKIQTFSQSMKSWFLRYSHLFSLVFVHDFILTGGYLRDTDCGMSFEDQLNYFKLNVMLRSSDDLSGQNLGSKKVNRVFIEVYFGGSVASGCGQFGF